MDEKGREEEKFLREQENELNCDDILDEIGGWTKWHLVFFFIIGIFTMFFCSFHYMAIIFIGQPPAIVHCALPKGVSVNESVPIEMDPMYGFMRPSQCSVYKNYSRASNQTEPCPNGWYMSEERYSLVNSFELICDKAVLVETSQFVVALGGMFVGAALSLLADIFGRKPVFFGATFVTILLLIANAFVNNYIAYIGVRFFMQGTLSAGITSGYVIMCEVFRTKNRSDAIMISEIPWAVGMMALALVAWLIPNWRHLMLWTSVPFLTIILCFGFIPESPAWLLSKGRLEEAKEELRKIVRFNKSPMPKALQNMDGRRSKQSFVEQFKDGFKSMCKSGKSEDKKTENSEGADENLFTLFKSPILVFYIIIGTYIFLTLFLVYMGVTYNTGSLSGDLYVNFCLSGLAEFPSVLICVVGLRYIGRKPLTGLTLVLCGLSLFALLALDITGNKGIMVEVEMTLAMICKFAITAAFLVAILFFTEIFPTTVRSTSLSVALFGGKIGGIVAPYTSYVSRIYPWLPLAIFGGMSMLAGLLTLTLPETRGQALPVTIAEFHANRKKNKEELQLQVTDNNNKS